MKLETKYYLLGLATASICSLLIAAGGAAIVGYDRVISLLENQYSAEANRVLIVPDSIEQLWQQGIIDIDNTYNYPRPPREERLLTKATGDALRYALKPNVVVRSELMPSQTALNWNPPFISFRKDLELPKGSLAYLNSVSRLSVKMSTNEKGLRSTIPLVDAEKKVLIVGDSVAFGAYVHDSATIASKLQALLGNRYQVVNGGVGGYSGRQAFHQAELLSAADEYEVLVYVACENDFEGYSIEEAQHVLEMFSEIGERFDNRVIVLLSTYLYYTSRDLFQRKDYNQSISRLSEAIEKAAREHGYIFRSWDDIVQNYKRKTNTIFAGFSLYVDQVHLSDLGSQVAADELFEAIGEYADSTANPAL